MALEVGTRIGPYEIAAPLGAGGMGEVYRAQDERLKREVALKLLPDRTAHDPHALERFRREAQLMAGLNHPHLAGVYGLEATADGRAALAMELVPGPTLAERLRSGPIPRAQVLQWALQLAEVLEYAHDQGVIHRDLKPANIKLTASGDVKVLDFGLAKALAPEDGPEAGDATTLTAGLTLPGALLGTPAYAAPEQIRGEAVDRRADIWAFGAVLYEMWTGQRAATGKTVAAVLASVLEGEPDWTRLAEAPPKLQALIQRCLRKDVRQRQRAIADVRLELEELAEKGEDSPTVAPARRSSWATVALATAVGVVIGALGWGMWQRRAPLTPSAHFQRITKFTGVQMQPAISPDGRSVAFASNHEGDFNLYVTVIGGGILKVTQGAEVKAHPAWSPSGSELAYAQLNRDGLWDIWSVAALGGTPRLLIRDAADPTWSPDGKWLAYTRTSNGGLWISRPTGENARLLAAPRQFANIQPRFSPDGSRIAFVDQAIGPYGVVRAIALASGEQRALSERETLAQSPVWSPDGKAVYFSCGHTGTVNIWKVSSTGGAMVQVTTGQGDDTGLDLSADGKRLVFSTLRSDFRLARVALPPRNAALTILTTDPARNELQPSFSPDGSRITFFTGLKGMDAEQVWIARADGSEAVPVTADEEKNLFSRWSEDGKSVIFMHAEVGKELASMRRVPVGGGAASAMVEADPSDTFDVGAGDRLLYMNMTTSAIEAYQPGEKAPKQLAAKPRGMALATVRWMPNGHDVALITKATRDDDPGAGVWVWDFVHAPRQVFRGWVLDAQSVPGGRLYILAGGADLKSTVWTVDGTGARAEAMPGSVPTGMRFLGRLDQVRIGIAPRGDAMGFDLAVGSQANLGMLTFEN